MYLCVCVSTTQHRIYYNLCAAAKEPLYTLSIDKREDEAL